MLSLRVRPRFPARPRLQAQRGVVMVLVLVALVLLLVAVAGMLRSADSTTSVVGNLAFRRDLTNRAELAIAAAKTALNAGGTLYGATAADNAAANYSSVRLAAPASSNIGVPAALVSDAAYTALGYSCMNGSGTVLASASCTPGTDGILIRWTIDRQCVATGTFSTANCAYLEATKDAGGTAHSGPKKPKGAARGLYRITVRVTGPRNTEAYIQTTAG